MSSVSRQFGLVLSGLGEALLALYWLPVRLLRLGIRRGLGATARAFSGGMAIERWKRGLLPRSYRSGGSYQQMLPSGRRLEITIRLVGGEPGPAFLEVNVDDETAILLFAERPGQAVPSEVTLDGRAAVHHRQSQVHLTRVLGPEVRSSAHRLVRWVALLLE